MHLRSEYLPCARLKWAERVHVHSYKGGMNRAQPHDPRYSLHDVRAVRLAVAIASPALPLWAHVGMAAETRWGERTGGGLETGTAHQQARMPVALTSARLCCDGGCGRVDGLHGDCAATQAASACVRHDAIVTALRGGAARACRGEARAGGQHPTSSSRAGEAGPDRLRRSEAEVGL